MKFSPILREQLDKHAKMLCQNYLTLLREQTARAQATQKAIHAIFDNCSNDYLIGEGVVLEASLDEQDDESIRIERRGYILDSIWGRLNEIFYLTRATSSEKETIYLIYEKGFQDFFENPNQKNISSFNKHQNKALHEIFSLRPQQPKVKKLENLSMFKPEAKPIQVTVNTGPSLLSKELDTLSVSSPVNV